MNKKPHSAMLCEVIAEGESNPFWTLEAIQEHCNMLWSWWNKFGDISPIENGRRIIYGKTGDFDFELYVIERYVQEVFNSIAAIMPDLYAASKGDQQALERLKPILLQLANAHQAHFDTIIEKTLINKEN